MVTMAVSVARAGTTSSVYGFNHSLPGSNAPATPTTWAESPPAAGGT